MEPSLKIFVNSQGFMKLTINNQTFRRNRTDGSKIYWRCTQNCRASAITVENSLIRLKESHTCIKYKNCSTLKNPDQRTISDFYNGQEGNFVESSSKLQHLCEKDKISNQHEPKLHKPECQALKNEISYDNLDPSNFVSSELYAKERTSQGKTKRSAQRTNLQDTNVRKALRRQSEVKSTKNSEKQASLGTLGSGLLNPSYLQTGGLVFSSPDGSGPQAKSLAAAIYGVAIPPGVDHFSAHNNFFSRESPFTGSQAAIQFSDILSDSGLAFSSRSVNDGRQNLEGFSTFISDFSAFGGLNSANGNNDVSPSSSSVIQIDPIAARFGAIITNSDNQDSLYYSSFSGSSGTSVGNSISTGLGRSENSNVPSATAPEQPLVSTSTTNKKSPDDIISTTLQFSNGPITKTEEIQRTFEQASGKFTAAIIPANYESPKSLKQENIDSFSVPVETKYSSNKHFASPPERVKELQVVSKGQIISKSPSPYVYRKDQHDRQLAQQSEIASRITQPSSRTLGIPFVVKPEKNAEGSSYAPVSTSENRSTTYAFLMAPGYHTPQKLTTHGSLNI